MQSHANNKITIIPKTSVERDKCSSTINVEEIFSVSWLPKMFCHMEPYSKNKIVFHDLSVKYKRQNL